ncbi:uncharacterized protein RJT21DRAFT_47658 [Scheffersomyces amazonensis]|uniref:uncharacterized protein n=1 Tax=Scheffersomyces amazonensis TaxID=1078765 RepID=UPI00315C7197
MMAKTLILAAFINLAAYIQKANALNIRNDPNREYGSYVNPNPRPYEKCPTDDLIKLSGCCNDVLTKLDDCKADDLACECCALQSIKQECYHLCPGNPSANFLSVLLDDCGALNDVNACSIPFKKDDEIGTQKNGAKSIVRAKASRFNSDSDSNHNELHNSVTVKSKIVDKLNYNVDNSGSHESNSKIKILLDNHENEEENNSHDTNIEAAIKQDVSVVESSVLESSVIDTNSSKVNLTTSLNYTTNNTANATSKFY